MIIKGETSWNAPGGYSFVLYKPNGEIETSLDFDSDSYEAWNSRDELEKYDFYYLGEGTFTNSEFSKFYFVKTGKWMKYNMDYNVKDLLSFADNNFSVLSLKDNVCNIINAEGIVQRLDIPELSWRASVKGISKNYILFLDQNGYGKEIYRIFDMQERKLDRYEGKAWAYINPIEHSEINNDYFAFAIKGVDRREYVALINNNTLEDACDPIYINDSDAFVLKQDVLIVTKDDETQLIDFQGNILSTYGNEDTIFVKDGIVACKFEGGGAGYYLYDGTRLFGEYDFSNAIDLETMIN